MIQVLRQTLIESERHDIFEMLLAQSEIYSENSSQGVLIRKIWQKLGDFKQTTSSYINPNLNIQ